ncbi:Ribosomal protein L25/Gln-tRNA synthetase, anti-codon-binding domain-containing protein [Heracleum sosnowskyi]|uniref:Ribosomal protein L25/Gln-tRNA synthetase, anti-codon-binding domain-containing protein n=1 Tax=Heracleum sosnowskyi TaxID=360622 RepID=A0AAD8IG73_9APIA|nr:Ribosomal protein L25/Gln-tRNA synthetase, anti-codon-binding domain-containing protein [Heracleum sosnowskyi]
MISQWRRAAGDALKKSLHTSRYLHTIEAIPREFTGKKLAVKERAQGRIPAVVLALNDVVGNALSRKHLITTEKDQIQSVIDSVQLPFFCSTTFSLQIRAGSGSSTVLESGNVLPIKVHRDEETGKVLNLVFVWLDEGSKLKVDVPIVFKGEDTCIGIEKGGSLNKIRSSLKYLCPSEHIPSKIEVDVSTLDIGDAVSMLDAKVHPSLKLLSKNEAMPVCKIVAPLLDHYPTAPEEE